MNKQRMPCLVADDLPTALDAEFVRHGRTWRVTVATNTFIIGTAVDAVLNSRGEPLEFADIIIVEDNGAFKDNAPAIICADNGAPKIKGE